MIKFEEISNIINTIWVNGKETSVKEKFESGIATYYDEYTMEYHDTFNKVQLENKSKLIHEFLNEFAMKLNEIHSIKYSKIVLALNCKDKIIEANYKKKRLNSRIVQIISVTEHSCKDGIVERVYSKCIANSSLVEKDILKNIYEMKDYIVRRDKEKRMLNTCFIQEGKYNVYLSPQAGGIMIHELFGHLFEKDNNYYNKGLIAQMLEHNLDKSINVADVPSFEGIGGSMKTDDFNDECKDLKIVTDGFISPQVIKGERIENKRIGNYAAFWKYRISNTIMQAGNVSREDLLKEEKRCIFISKVDQCFCDPIRGRVLLPVIEAYECKKGVKTAIIRPFTISTTVIELWRSIYKIDSSFEQDTILCGKLGDELYVGMGSPGILLHDLEI